MTLQVIRLFGYDGVTESINRITNLNCKIMIAITIIEMMCRLNDCEQMGVFDCYDETCTEDCYLAGYFGAETQVGAFEAGHEYFYVWDADVYAVEELSKIEKPDVELCTLDNGCIYLWKIE